MFLYNVWYQNNSCLERKASLTVEVIRRNDTSDANNLNHRKTDGNQMTSVMLSNYNDKEIPTQYDQLCYFNVYAKVL
uniref:Cadherin domain-containing protein n=1 Tax=Strongyloides venezuelensis TaxID=75913 RepID=A0A0K0FTJ8_STRVS